MAQTSVIHARIDPETKAATERVLDSIGLSPTEAIRLFYRQIAIRGEFPLELKVPNPLTAAVLAAADRGEDMESFQTADELYASWEK
jgi:DNA-damage-inducible protein J